MLQADTAQAVFSVHFEKACYDRDPEKMAARGYFGAKISLKEYDVPTLIPVVEAMLMS